MANLFMGTFETVLSEVINFIPIDCILAEDKPASAKVVALGKKLGLEVRMFRTYDELVAQTGDFKKIGICFIAGFGTILRNDFIQKCDAVVNMHLGDVADCRGRHPLPTAILRKDRMMTATIHLIDSEKIDAGPILGKTSLPIDYDKNYTANEIELLKAAVQLTREVLNQYKRTGSFRGQPWKAPDGSYQPKVPSETLERVFRARTLKEL
ncbi:MAG TPA: formyltransferase family protein [Candidatus Omnitrophota bacterium]|nr:formyltransferase family protein [Candidatus Omnitrophota bacterium]